MFTWVNTRARRPKLVPNAFIYRTGLTLFLALL
jgi:hypothetical protein